MTPEERMLERFTRERLKGRAGATSMFNLDDGEEEGLTHYGKSLNHLDEMDDVALGDDDGKSR
jgi:nucleolar protein 14